MQLSMLVGAAFLSDGGGGYVRTWSLNTRSREREKKRGIYVISRDSDKVFRIESLPIYGNTEILPSGCLTPVHKLDSGFASLYRLVEPIVSDIMKNTAECICPMPDH